MATLLALLEGSVIFAALAIVLVGTGRALPGFGLLASDAFVLAGGLALAAVAALYYADCYEFRVVSGVRRFVARLPRCLALAAVAFAGAYALHPSGGVAAAWTGLFIVGLLPLVRTGYYRLLRSRWLVTRVLIVGSSSFAQQVVDAIETEGYGRFAIVGVAAEGPRVALGPVAVGDPVVGRLDQLDRILELCRPHRIVVALAERRGRLPVPPLLEARLRGVVVEEGVELYERLTGKIAIESVTPSSVIFSPDFRPTRTATLAGRAVSLLIAAAGLVCLAPVLALIALAIRVDSRGPIFFVQERVGLHGRRFKLIKFRTMSAATAAPSEWERDNTARITRVGYWLRKFRLDELPQFVNVLRGDMDLVGPRPHPVTNFSLFVTVLRNSPECGEQIPYYSVRCMVRPGITGWAQVRYRYANTLEEEIEKVRYDLFYVKHRSIWLDTRILLESVRTVLAGRGVVETEARPGEAPAPSKPWWTLVPRPR
jgi:exopolysaccharide biosynthesis polyprenyl glycosylphosphotransferase